MTRKFRPEVSITIGGRALGAPEAALLAVRVDLGVGSGHDQARILLGRQSPFASAAPGDTFELALGYDGDTTAVLTGAVATIYQQPLGSLVEALAATSVLSSTRTGQAFLSQSVADIVRSLAGEGSVATDQIEATLRLDAYHVDERRSVWDHLQDLARLVGCETSCDEKGRLRFRPPAGSGGADGGLGGVASAAASLVGAGSGKGLRMGAELLAWDLRTHAGDADPAMVVASGASNWHVLLKEPDGGAPSGLVLVPSAVRTRDAAQAMEKGLAAVAGRAAAGGRLAVVGDATVRPGDQVSVADVPAGGGPYRAVAVCHRVSGITGFQSQLTLEGAA